MSAATWSMIVRRHDCLITLHDQPLGIFRRHGRRGFRVVGDHGSAVVLASEDVHALHLIPDPPDRSSTWLFFSDTLLKRLLETCQLMKTPWQCSELRQKVGQFRRSAVCANQLIFGRREQRPTKCPAAGHREHAAPPLPPSEKRRKTEGLGRLSRPWLFSFFDVVEELPVFVQHLGTFEFPRLVVLRNAQVLPPVVTPSKSRLAEAPETKVRNYWRGVTTVRWKSSRQYSNGGLVHVPQRDPSSLCA